MKTLYGQEARDKVWQMIREIKFALMATYDTQGKIFHARPMMAQQHEFGGILWFMTGADSRKVAEIRNNPRSLLTYADPQKQNYISIAGSASVVHDQQKINELWTEFARPWFPKGKEDPNLTLIRFETEEAEFWDSPSGVVLNAYDYIKAVLTGESSQLGARGHVEFSG